MMLFVTPWLVRCLKPLVLLAACVAGLGVQAQSLRDPTAPPAAVAPLVSATPGVTPVVSSSTSLDTNNLSLIVRDGVRFLVVGTRLFKQGQTVGQAKIQRITETEVWLLEGGRVRKLPIFAGIERRAAVPAVSASKSAVGKRSHVVKP
jgi:hypothetical protein